MSAPPRLLPTAPRRDGLVQPVLRNAAWGRLCHHPGGFCPGCALSAPCPTCSSLTRTLSLCCYSTGTLRPVPWSSPRDASHPFPSPPGTTADPSPRDPSSLSDDLVSPPGSEPLEHIYWNPRSPHTFPSLCPTTRSRGLHTVTCWGPWGPLGDDVCVASREPNGSSTAGGPALPSVTRGQAQDWAGRPLFS